MWRTVEEELVDLKSSIALGNTGRARVCARRAVIQHISTIYPKYGTSVKILDAVCNDSSLPETIRRTAGKLSGGLRAQLHGEVYSTDPLAEALELLQYFGYEPPLSK